ncbi:MAG: hypothetical protein JXR10_09595 [Cyclobacteriaceae bacterium]
MPEILLKKLQCIVNDEIDEDEVYLKYDGKKIWPEDGIYKGIDNSETFELGVTVNHSDPNKVLTIELWDFDYLSPNDFLGTFDIRLGHDTHGSFSTSMALKEEGSTASYILHWQFVD